ncbi:MAG: MmcQ/YjbR family DNA-binding protein [Treponema sp.]|nr:MmcQ/YjbR family DNA-binding protein [Treponema sp.]
MYSILGCWLCWQNRNFTANSHNAIHLEKMTYNHLYSAYLPIERKFVPYGFTKLDNGTFFLKKDLPINDLYAELFIDIASYTLEVHVFDSKTNERYTLFDVHSSRGTFVSEVRRYVQFIIDDIFKKCFTFKNLQKDYIKFLANRFSAMPEYPWREDKSHSLESQKNIPHKSTNYSDYAVFRCPNKKWFALIMNITYRQLGFATKSEEMLWCVNLKASPDKIPNLIDKKIIFPAYHMNKKHWINVIISAVCDFKKLCKLTEDSYELVLGK